MSLLKDLPKLLKTGIRRYNDGHAVSCAVFNSGVNEWGIAGLAGNVWEWCNDWYDKDKTYKIRHGASWDFDTRDALPVSFRGFDRPKAKYDTIGFRLVITGPPRNG